MAITAHYAVKDENGHLFIHSRLIAFRAVPISHTGINLARVFYGILKEYGITHKVFTNSTLDILENEAYSRFKLARLRSTTSPIMTP